MAHYTISFKKDEEIFSPKSLQQMCTQVCATEAKSILFEEKKLKRGTKLKLKPNLNISGLPQEKVDVSRKILESILEACDHSAPEFVRIMLEVCENVMQGRLSLKRVNLNNCKLLTDSQFEEIMKVKPVSLEIHKCPLLTDKAFGIINKYGENLESLNFGDSAKKIISTDFKYWKVVQNDSLAEWDVSLGLLNTPKLRHLTIWNWFKFKKDDSGDVEDRVEWLTRRFIGRLEHLDLSFSDCVETLEFLLKAKDTLKFLSLNDAIRSPENIRWDILTKLCKLKFLDLAYCHINDKKTGIVEKIVKSLPELTHLDLTSSSLAVSEIEYGSGNYRIDALKCREKRPLEFVNLYFTDIISRCQLLPARVVVWRKDEGFNKLMSVVKCYSQPGELPTALIDSLEIISKRNMADDKFPWKEAFNLVFQVVGTNQDYLYISHPTASSVFDIFCAALKEPHQLAHSQKDQIFKCVVKLLNQDWRDSDVLKNVLFVLLKLDRAMDLWNPQKAKILVTALLRAARNAIKKDNESEDYFVDRNFVRYIELTAEFLLNNLSESTRVALIRTLVSDREILDFVREVMNIELMGSCFENIARSYWKILDKIVIRKLGY